MNSVVVEDSSFTSCSADDGEHSSLIMEGGFLSSSFVNPTILRINRTTFTKATLKLEEVL